MLTTVILSDDLRKGVWLVSFVTGSDIVYWLRLNVRGIDDVQAAIHLAFIMAIHG